MLTIRLIPSHSSPLFSAASKRVHLFQSPQGYQRQGMAFGCSLSLHAPLAYFHGCDWLLYVWYMCMLFRLLRISLCWCIFKLTFPRYFLLTRNRRGWHPRLGHSGNVWRGKYCHQGNSLYKCWWRKSQCSPLGSRGSNRRRGKHACSRYVACCCIVAAPCQYYKLNKPLAPFLQSEWPMNCARRFTVSASALETKSSKLPRKINCSDRSTRSWMATMAFESF